MSETLYIYRGELLIPDHYYKMTVFFEGMTWYNYVWFTQRILWLLDGLSVGAKWISGINDVWYLHYHLKASGASVMHSEIIDTIMAVYHRAVVMEIEDLEEREALFEPDVPLPDIPDIPVIKEVNELWVWFVENWKGLAGVIIGIIVLLVILPYGYKRRR